MIDALLPFLPAMLVAWGILLVGASSPGPAVAMLMGLATGQGRTAALTACAGIALASVTLNVLTMLGVSLILSQAAWAMMGLRLLGAAYLLYLAYGAFKKAITPPQIEAAAVEHRSTLQLFAMGYAIQVLNPKAVAFWLAIAAVGATTSAPLGVAAFFVISCAAISFVCHGAWALLLSATPVRRAYHRLRRYVEGALGAFLTFAAFKLATSRI